MGRAWYVKGRKHAFPYGERLVSGPFDEITPAYDELHRIRPFYPDANLDVVHHRAKTLPERTPRTAPPGSADAGPLIVAATGHRWQRLDIPRTPETECWLEAIAAAFLEQLRPDRVLSGLALGWDTAVAMASVRLGIPLEACMPGKRGQQEARWDWGDQGTHEWLVRQSAAHSWIGDDLPFPKACISRDEYMVGRAGLVVALWSGAPSGTGTTVRFAERRKLPVVNLWGLHRP